MISFNDQTAGTITQTVEVAIGSPLSFVSQVTAPPAAPVTISYMPMRPQLLIQYITQDPIISSRMPPVLVYDYDQIQFTSQSINNVSSTTGAGILTMNAIKVPSIPSTLMFYLRPNKFSDNTVTSTFLRITKFSLNWGNKIALFSTYTEEDLYKMSVANGLQDTIEDWKYGCGSLLIINVTNDVCLESDESSGQNSYATMQAVINYDVTPLQVVNNATANIDYDGYVVVVTPGKCLIDSNSAAFVTNGVSASEVLSLTAHPGENKLHEDDAKANTTGGSILSSFGKLLHKGLSVAKLASEHIKPEHIETANNYLKKITGGALKNKRVY